MYKKKTKTTNYSQKFITFANSLSSTMANTHNRSRWHAAASTWVLTAWAMACWAFFEWCYPYHFFFKEQQQLVLLTKTHLSAYLDQGCGWMASLVGDLLTQLYYYRFAGAVVLTLCLLAVGLPLWLALRRCGVGRMVATAIALVAMTVEAVFQLRPNFPLSATVAVALWAVALWLAVLLVTASHRRWRRHLALAASLAIVALAAWTAGTPRLGRIAAPNWEFERYLAIDNEYYFGNYDRVVSLVEQTEDPSQEMKFFYNLVMAQRGELPDHLLQLPATDLGTFYHIGPDTPLPTIRMMNELYWALGDMTFTERAAMMACVFSANNRNVRMVRRLAECNLVSGNEAAAAKYLRLLSHTLAYRQTARQLPQKIAQSGKAAFQNRQDTLAVSDNAHFLMMQLLDSNPDNTVALDYLLCSDLLLKDINNFKRDYDRYCTDRPRLKRLYQEALCIYLAGTNAPEEQWRRYIVMGDVVSRFSQYNQQRRHPSFKGTYWYYFDTAKPPVPQ